MRRVLLPFWAVLALVAVPVTAQDLVPQARTLQTELPPLNPPPSEWQLRKCALYGDAWAQMTAGEGLSGVSAAFQARHQEFLDAGCQIRGQVCPESEAELHLADRLSLMAVAEGMAGSFLPFAC